MEHLVSPPLFLTLFFCACGALALWIDARLADRGPSSLRSVVLFLVIGMIGLNVAKGMAVTMISPDNPRVTIAVLFVVVLPALVYVFLTTIWLLRIVRGAMPR
jgi:hypothetical protein